MVPRQEHAMRQLIPVLLWAIVLPSVMGRSADVSVVAGPMVGHVTDRSARIWFQLPIAGEVSLSVIDAQRNAPVSGLRVGITGPSPFVCDVPVNNLEPDRAYRIEATFEGKPLPFPAPHPNLLIRTAPPPGDEA